MSDANTVTVDDAKAYLGDFIDVASLKDTPEADVIALHGKISSAVAKHAPKPGSGPYYEEFKDPAVKDWVKSYKDAYPTPESIAMKALNLEKFIGAEKAGRGVVMPKADAKAEEWQAFFKKTGLVPEKVEGYQLPKDFEKDPILTKVREHAHKVGIPAPIFNEVMGALTTEMKAIQTNKVKDWEAAAEKEYNEVIASWGADADANKEYGMRAANAFIPHANKDELNSILTKLEGALGTKMALTMWANIGKAIKEHGFVGGDGGGGDGSMSPEAARMRITELKKDPGFAKKLADGDADSKAEWDKLHKIGFGTLAPA